jgi:DNA ligase 4
VLLHILKNRTRNTTKKLSIKQLNVNLDELSTSSEKKGKVSIVTELIQSSNIIELKWLSKIILKDLKLGIGHETLLKMYHPHALELFNATSDLKAAFTQVKEFDAKTAGGKGQNIFKMFFPVKPMLAGKLRVDQIAELIELNNTDFLVETKFDGERIQCHI